jgi:PTS system mannose-specific IIA component
MIGILIITHGDLAKALLESAQHIAGETLPFKTLTIGWNQQFKDIHREVGEAIEAIDCGDGVLVLTDLLGGTPSNVALSFVRKRPNIEVVTGVNLPILVKLATHQNRNDATVRDIARSLVDKGVNSIQLLSEYDRKQRSNPHSRKSLRSKPHGRA